MPPSARVMIDSGTMTPPTREITNERFWQSFDELVKAKPIAIDRPAGSAHPRYPDLIYPLDYGYLDETQSMDGGGIDVWVGGLGLGPVTGVVTTVDLLKNDAELKILIGCTADEMTTIEAHHNGQFQSGLLVIRE